MDGYPIIRLTVGDMRRQVVKALVDARLDMDEDIQQAVDAACAPEAISKLVREEVERATIAVVREAVSQHLRVYDGREDLRKLIINALRGGEGE